MPESLPSSTTATSTHIAAQLATVVDGIVARVQDPIAAAAVLERVLQGDGPSESTEVLLTAIRVRRPVQVWLCKALR